MAMGRPRKPTGLHELEGTVRKDRHNQLEPQPKKGLPDRPMWVEQDPVTASLFDAVTKYVDDMKISTAVDGIALGLLADQLGLYITLREAIREDGSIISETGEGPREAYCPPRYTPIKSNTRKHIQVVT